MPSLDLGTFWFAEPHFKLKGLAMTLELGFFHII